MWQENNFALKVIFPNPLKEHVTTIYGTKLKQVGSIPFLSLLGSELKKKKLMSCC